MGKLERAEAEAIVAGALTDWVRAAQRGADAVASATRCGLAAGGLEAWGGECGSSPFGVFNLFAPNAQHSGGQSSFGSAPGGTGGADPRPTPQPFPIPTMTPEAQRPAAASPFCESPTNSSGLCASAWPAS